MYHKVMTAPGLPLTLCAAAVLALALPAADAASPSWIVGADHLGTLHVTPATTALQALRYLSSLGAPPVTLRFHGGCALYSSGVGVGIEGCRGSLLRFTVTGRRWQTRFGVHVGSTIASLRRAYPEARDWGLGKGGPGVAGWVAEWEIGPRTPGSHAAHPELFAETSAGRVVALEIGMVGH